MNQSFVFTAGIRRVLIVFVNSQGDQAKELRRQNALDIKPIGAVFGLRRSEFFNSAVDEMDSGTPLGACNPNLSHVLKLRRLLQ